jgi:hypothetical protein
MLRGSENYSFVKGRGFLDHMKDYWLLKKHFALSVNHVTNHVYLFLEMFFLCYISSAPLVLLEGTPRSLPVFNDFYLFMADSDLKARVSIQYFRHFEAEKIRQLHALLAFNPLVSISAVPPVNLLSVGGAVLLFTP